MTVEVTTKNIEDLRAAFLKELEDKGGPSLIHPNDLNRITSRDDWLKRFLLHHDNGEKEALAMLWESVLWRKEFKTNEINESNVNMEFIKEGILFTHGRDVDGYALFIFKCKRHQKGLRDFDEVKRCVIYWLERIEREENGNQLSIFFEMEGCGLSNVDMELIKYIIHVFKQYYPFMLNYIIILEMAWILNALFKVIKTMLPEKAVQKIKMIKKPDLHQYVAPDQALKCWGGEDNYSFVFVSETEAEEVTSPLNTTTSTNKKVHFADGSPMSENQGNLSDKESGDGGSLKVAPSGVITFIKEGSELISTLELQNVDNKIVSYKMKTTSPEKFRVRPSAGCLAPGESTSVSVTLLTGFQLGGLSRDKFLVMSMPVESTELSAQELADLWKNPSNKNITQHRLRCAQSGDFTKNGIASGGGGQTLDSESNQIHQLTNRLTQISNCQSQLHVAIKHTQLLQWITMSLVFLLSIMTIWVLKQSSNENNSAQVCYKNEDILLSNSVPQQ